MKRNIKFNILGWLAAAALLLTTSCTDTLSEVFGGGEYETVTFTIMPETANGMATRVDKDSEISSKVPYGEGSHISDGTKADMLIYAVYEWDDETKTATLLDSYADGKGEGVPAEVECGDGQTIQMVKDRFPVEVTLKVKRNKTYKVAFWAQSSKCYAYSTEDLTRVQMHYSQGDGNNAPNNEELRDAFCTVETIVVNKEMKTDRIIYLYRPLAQINVGTTGYDYESVVRDEKWKYAYTRVHIETVARYLNVVEDKITGIEDTENASVVDYGYARIPAYINYDDKAWKEVDLATASDDEEFLKVHLEGVEHEAGYDFKPYVSYDDYAATPEAEKNKIQTETFKYLSMSYVLVPSETKEGKDGERNTYERTSVDNVKVWIATAEEASDDETGMGGVQIVDIQNVPVQRNYRTNIVGNIMTEDVNINVVLDPIYAGDYNGLYKDGGESVEWSGPLAEGVYYDAEKDEIQISNVNGLLWLQRMVNGNMVCRESTTESAKGKAYAYYDLDGNEYTCDAIGNVFNNYEYIKEPKADEALRARIMRATHQDGKQLDYNISTDAAVDGEWPTNSNFHFMNVKLGTGKNANVYSEMNPAKIKLMADIDLSGIDWIPIGFDCQFSDVSSYFDARLNTLEKQTSATTSATTSGKGVRAFCGIFDGNGHTISNLKNYRFGAQVHSDAEQKDGYGPYDNPQWFATGLFGFVSGNAEIKNLRLTNVDLYGYHTGGGIVGTVNGINVKIDSCTVDGGKIELSPMYRGDGKKNQNPYGANTSYRTFARGIYAGGIVGYCYGKPSVTNCNVSNMTLRAYRNLGGIIGTDGYNEGDPKKKAAATVEGNTVSNTLIIADKFKPYDFLFGVFRDGVYKSGYGWNQSQFALSGDIVGGNSGKSAYGDNSLVNVIRTEFSTRAEEKSIEREAEIGNVPVDVLPILSSWFCDKIKLKANYSGKPSAFKRHALYKCKIDKITAEDKNTSKKSADVIEGEHNIFPFGLPNDLSVDFNTRSGKAGVYVESVELDGQHGTGDAGYSVLTVEDVNGQNDCAMFITSRDTHPFKGNNHELGRQSTTVKNMLVRGNPWAYTGICLSPNQYTDKITLENVSVYDCYQTLALDNGGESEQGKVWPAKDDISTSNVPLSVSSSNLRGYTVPGAGWKSVTYTNVVFEKGARTVDADKEQTCVVDNTTEGTTFTNCTFKAPFTIEIKDGATVTFNNCQAVFGVKTTPIDAASGTKKITVSATGDVSYE